MRDLRKLARESDERMHRELADENRRLREHLDRRDRELAAILPTSGNGDDDLPPGVEPDPEPGRGLRRRPL